MKAPAADLGGKMQRMVLLGTGALLIGFVGAYLFGLRLYGGEVALLAIFGCCLLAFSISYAPRDTD